MAVKVDQPWDEDPQPPLEYETGVQVAEIDYLLWEIDQADENTITKDQLISWIEDAVNVFERLVLLEDKP